MLYLIQRWTFCPPSPGPDDVRLVDGSSRCAGTLEIFHSGEWRGVTADRWSMKEAAVMCRQLDCGSAVKSTMSVSGGGETGFHIACKGSESAVKECTILYSSKIRYPVGVVCSGNSTNKNEVRLTLWEPKHLT